MKTTTTTAITLTKTMKDEYFCVMAAVSCKPFEGTPKRSQYVNTYHTIALCSYTGNMQCPLTAAAAAVICDWELFVKSEEEELNIRSPEIGKLIIIDHRRSFNLNLNAALMIFSLIMSTFILSIIPSIKGLTMTAFGDDKGEKYEKRKH
uniref:Uncharacterized protein n=1 Tax=Glossina austeni TaxID=7395 RepID=A0A1A9V4G5_GLOAU